MKFDLLCGDSMALQVPSPTCADAPDDTRLEFKDFKKQAQSLASVAWRNTRATEVGGSLKQLQYPLAKDFS